MDWPSLYTLLFNMMMYLTFIFTVVYWPLKWFCTKTACDSRDTGLIIVLWIGRIAKCLWIGWIYYHLYFFLRIGMSPVVTIIMMVFGTGGFVFAYYFWKAATAVEKMKIDCK